MMENSDDDIMQYLEYFHFGWQLGDNTVSQIESYVKTLKLGNKEAMKAERIIADATSTFLLMSYLIMFKKEDMESICKDLVYKALILSKKCERNEEEYYTPSNPTS